MSSIGWISGPLSCCPVVEAERHFRFTLYEERHLGLSSTVYFSFSRAEGHAWTHRRQVSDYGEMVFYFILRRHDYIPESRREQEMPILVGISWHTLIWT